jgi:hypothetical protein
MLSTEAGKGGQQYPTQLARWKAETAFGTFNNGEYHRRTKNVCCNMKYENQALASLFVVGRHNTAKWPNGQQNSRHSRCEPQLLLVTPQH